MPKDILHSLGHALFDVLHPAHRVVIYLDGFGEVRPWGDLRQLGGLRAALIVGIPRGGVHFETELLLD